MNGAGAPLSADLQQAPAVPPDAPEGPRRRAGANLYVFSSFIAQGAALARYVALARLLGPEQLGLATTLVVTAAFFDQVSDTGGDKFLVQDRHGDEPEVQKLVQSVYALRGIVTAVLLVAVSIPVSMFYGQPRLVTGLCFLGLSPLVLGFLHMDNRRSQRWMDFRADAISAIVGEIAGLAFVLAAAWISRTYTAILYGLVARAVFTVGASHLLAKRRYALGWSRMHLARVAAFSGPLMLNGLMLFVGSQADRMVVGNQLGVKSLGLYSAVLLLIYYPVALLVRSMLALYIPEAAQTRDDPALRDRVTERLGGRIVGLSICMAAGFAVVAPVMVTVLYGERFRQTALLIGLIGILQTSRFLITWPTAMALGLGRSRTVLAANTTRLLVLPGAFIGLRLIGGLEGVVVGFIAGELLAVALGLLLLNRIREASLLSGFDRLFLFALVALDIVGWNLVGRSASTITWAALLVGTIALAGVIVARERATIAESAVIASKLLSRVRRRLTGAVST